MDSKKKVRSRSDRETWGTVTTLRKSQKGRERVEMLSQKDKNKRWSDFRVCGDSNLKLNDIQLFQLKL